jgi:endonuclease/exonuclease/phosphatase family metal-dependent hydrolase
MKIYSWNVLCFNRKVSEVCDFIENLDFDVLCLQEVTNEMLARIQRMPFHNAYHLDVLRLFSKNNQEKNYVVILSRHEFLGTGTMQFPNLPLRAHTRAFIGFMSIFKWSWITERGAIYVDVKINEKKIRIFSVHLTLSGPGNRADEFALLAKHLPINHSSLVCGDFNVIEYGPLKILNFLLGSPLRESTPWYPERKLFEERFKNLQLHNPLRGMVTHKFSRSQLDHILVSDEITVKNAWVVPDRHGSDHQPVGVEI